MHKSSLVLAVGALWPVVSFGQAGLIIRVVDTAGVPDGVLRRATVLAKTMFHKAGVETEWLPFCVVSKGQVNSNDYPSCATSIPHDRDQVYIRILGGRGMVDPLVDMTVLGATNHEQRNAYVFYDRVEASKLADRPLQYALLAAVMAHEAGHILGLAHTSLGVMSAKFREKDIRDASLGTLTFTPSQAAELRRAITATLYELLPKRSDPQ